MRCCLFVNPLNTESQMRRKVHFLIGSIRKCSSEIIEDAWIDTVQHVCAEDQSVKKEVQHKHAAIR